MLLPNGNLVLRFRANNPGTFMFLFSSDSLNQELQPLSQSRFLSIPSLIPTDTPSFPGVWLFHCHVEWHMQAGLAATFVEAPAELHKIMEAKIPEDHLAVCGAAAAGGVPTAGNAAGNTLDWLDLRGEDGPPGRIPEG